MNYNKYFTPQIDENDCGVAAFSTILKFYGSTYSLAKLRKLTNTKANGTSALGIVRAATKLGFSSIGVSSKISQIQNQKPFIAQIITKKGFSHFIVVFNINNNTAIISDPDSTTGISKIKTQEFELLWTGIAILFKPTRKYTIFNEKIKKHINYLSLLKANLTSVFSLTLISICILFIEVIGAYFSQILLNRLIPKQNISVILLIASILIVSYIIQQIISYFQGIFTNNFYAHLAKSIISDFLHHIMLLPLLFFKTRTTGDITSRINDSYEIISSFAKLSVSLFINTITVLGLAIILFLQDKSLALISLALIPIYLIIFYSFYKSFNLRKKTFFENKAFFDAKLIETIRGIETIKSLSVEGNTIKTLQETFNTLMDSSTNFNKLGVLQQSLKVCISTVLNTIVLTFGSIQVIHGNLTIGQLITFNILLGLFSESVQQIIGLQSELQTAKVASNRMNEIFLLPTEKVSLKAKSNNKLSGKISVKNLTYHYTLNNKGVSNVSFSITPQSKIAIVGSSGSGKTTLVKVLSGLYQLKTGTVLYDNHPIEELSISTIRRLVQYVPQTPVLFKGTILDNLLYGLDNKVPMEKITYICDLVNLTSDIENMPQKFNTMLSENGTSLSGGQRQRLALARALLSNSKVLILDESTSSLDKLTERKILNRLLSLKDKTIIFIAHHMEIAKKADKILLLKDGSLIGIGTHTELLQNNQYYQLLN